MNEDYYLQISETLQKTFAPISDICTKLLPKNIDDLVALLEVLSKAASTLYSTEQIEDITMQLASLSKVVIPNINNMPTFPIEIFDFLKNISFDGNYINLTEDDCNTVNTILESSNNSDSKDKISKGKITLKDFIQNILMPLLTVILPMLLTIYLHKIDSIESQKVHIEELRLQEQENEIAMQQLQNDIAQKEILEKILNELYNFSESQESLQEADESLRGEIASPDEAQCFPAGNYCTEPIIHDEPSNSLPDIHKDQ